MTTAAAPVEGFAALGDSLVDLCGAFENLRGVHLSRRRPGSPADLEVRAADAGKWGRDTVRYAWVDALIPLTSATDHLMTLADVLRSPRGQFASYTLARGAIEAATKTWYLLEPGVGPDERGRRRLNDRLASLQAQVWLLEGAGDDAAELRDRIDDLLNSARPHYFVRAAKGVREPPFVQEKLPTEMALLRQMMAQAEEGVDVGGTTYRLLSGVAHAAMYGLAQMLEPAGASPLDKGLRVGHVRQSSVGAASHLLGAPLAYVEAANRVIDGYGWDPSAWTGPMVSALTTWRDHARQELPPPEDRR